MGRVKKSKNDLRTAAFFGFPLPWLQVQVDMNEPTKNVRTMIVTGAGSPAASLRGTGPLIETSLRTGRGRRSSPARSPAARADVLGGADPVLASLLRARRARASTGIRVPLSRRRDGTRWKSWGSGPPSRALFVGTAARGDEGGHLGGPDSRHNLLPAGPDPLGCLGGGADSRQDPDRRMASPAFVAAVGEGGRPGVV